MEQIQNYTGQALAPDNNDEINDNIFTSILELN